MGQRTKNLAVVRGNVGSTPEIRFTDTGKKVANFSIATHEKWIDQAGETHQETEWHKIVAFAPSVDHDAIAGTIEKYVQKGAFVEVRGRLKTCKWSDNEGIERLSTEIIIEDIDLLDKKEKDHG